MAYAVPRLCNLLERFIYFFFIIIRRGREGNKKGILDELKILWCVLLCCLTEFVGCCDVKEGLHA